MQKCKNKSLDPNTNLCKSAKSPYGACIAKGSPPICCFITW